MKFSYSYIILSIFLALSCSEEKVYTPLKMFDMAFKYDNTIEEVRINDPNRSLSCNEYPKGCITGSPKRFKIRLVEMIVVQYLTQEGACKAAAKLGQWHARNWLFDDVTNEPVLESFIKDVYDAKNPKSEEECD